MTDQASLFDCGPEETPASLSSMTKQQLWDLYYRAGYTGLVVGVRHPATCDEIMAEIRRRSTER